MRRSMFKGKSGSLSLSINAIVVLVLAITMLGLGLGFTKGMFGKLAGQISIPEPDIPATADDPIVLTKEPLEITKNKKTIFSANVYNNDFGSNYVGGVLICPAKDTAEALIAAAPCQTIEAGEDRGFKFIVEKEQVAVSATRVCVIGFFDAGDTISGCPADGPAAQTALDTADTIKQTKQVVVDIK